MQNRLLLALFLSLIVMGVWSTFFAPKPAPKQDQAAGQVEAPAEPTGAAPQDTTPAVEAELAGTSGLSAFLTQQAGQCGEAEAAGGPGKSGAAGEDCSAGFQTCCIADFEVGSPLECSGSRDIWSACRFGNPRYSRFGNLRYGFALPRDKSTFSLHSDLSSNARKGCVHGSIRHTARYSQYLHAVSLPCR